MSTNHSRRTRQSSILLIVLLTVILALAATCWAIISGFQTEDRTRTQASRSLSIIADLRMIEIALLNSETGQRGFILTENSEYLKPFKSGVSDHSQILAQLYKALDDGRPSGQRAALENLKSLSQQKIAELTETISMVEDGQRQAALALIQTDLGKNLMDQIRQEVSGLQREEQAIWQGAIAESEAVQARTSAVLLIAFLLITALLVVVLYLFKRSSRLDMTEELLAQVSLHRERADLLLAELSHRVKNLFGIVTSIVRMTGRGETESKVVVEKITERIDALSRAHALSMNGGDESVNLEELIRTILQPYISGGRKYTLLGPPISLCGNELAPLGMILHELATNAVKHGIWSTDNSGEIAICWSYVESSAHRSDKVQLKLSWKESTIHSLGKTSTEGNSLHIDQSTSGFGTRLIEMSVQQLDGQLDKRWNGGLTLELILTVEKCEADVT